MDDFTPDLELITLEEHRTIWPLVYGLLMFMGLWILGSLVSELILISWSLVVAVPICEISFDGSINIGDLNCGSQNLIFLEGPSTVMCILCCPRIVSSHGQLGIG